MPNLDDDFADMRARAEKKLEGRLPAPKKLSEMSLVDRYEVERKMGRFDGTFKEFVEKMKKEERPTPKMKKGGMPKKYNKGGMGTKANCGASVKASGGSRNK